MASVNPIAVDVPTVETVTVNGMVSGPRTPLTFKGSPAPIQNTTANRLAVVISGGTVSLIEFSRDGVTFDTVGAVAGQFLLNPGDMLQVTYQIAPTAASYPV